MDAKKGITKNVVILGIVSFLNDMASEMVYPVVPIFLTSVLGAPVFVVGLVEGIADSFSKISTAVFGIFSDRWHTRKPFVSWGYGLAASSHLIMTLSTTWPLVLLARVVNRTGKGVRTAARDALITESTDKSARGRSFGLHRSMDSLGAMTGPLLSIYLLKLFNDSYPKLFLSAFVPALLGLLILIFFIKEKRYGPLSFREMRFEWAKANISFKIFLLISFIFAVGNSSYAFMILRAQDLGLSIGLTIFTYVLLNTTYTALSLPAGIVADKIGSRKVLFIGYVIFSLVYFAFGAVTETWWVWVLFPAYGIFLALTDGVSKTYISRLVPHEISASAFGIHQTLLGLAAFLASAIGGALWTFVNPSMPFYFGGGLGILSAVLFLLLTKKIHPIQPVASKSQGK